MRRWLAARGLTPRSSSGNPALQAVLLPAALEVAMGAVSAPAEHNMLPGWANGHSHGPRTGFLGGADLGSGAAARGGTSGSGPGLLDPGARVDAPLAVACLLAMPPGEAEPALERWAAQPGASFASSRRALLLGLFTCSLQVQPTLVCALNQAGNRGPAQYQFVSRCLRL